MTAEITTIPQRAQVQGGNQLLWNVVDIAFVLVLTVGNREIKYDQPTVIGRAFFSPLQQVGQSDSTFAGTGAHFRGKSTKNYSLRQNWAADPYVSLIWIWSVEQNCPWCRSVQN